MSTQISPAKGSQWLRWFPAQATVVRNAWRLIRFEQVDADGKPVGNAITHLTPTNRERVFYTEDLAASAARLINQDERR